MKQRDTQGKGYGRKTSDKKKFSRPATLKAGHNLTEMIKNSFLREFFFFLRFVLIFSTFHLNEEVILLLAVF